MGQNRSAAEESSRNLQSRKHLRGLLRFGSTPTPFRQLLRAQRACTRSQSVSVFHRSLADGMRHSLGSRRSSIHFSVHEAGEGNQTLRRARQTSDWTRSAWSESIRTAASRQNLREDDCSEVCRQPVRSFDRLVGLSDRTTAITQSPPKNYDSNSRPTGDLGASLGSAFSGLVGNGPRGQA